MNVLVTGSGGFVGRHVVASLVGRGDNVTGVDLVDGDDCLDFFRQDTTTFDLAVHCAAIVGGRASIDGSPLAVATNLALDSHYFHWLQRTGTTRAVYFSSSAAYPTRLQQRGSDWRLAEDDVALRLPQMPDASYGWAKLTGELLAEQARAQGIRVLVLRPFSGYGADQDLDYPFPAFIDRARRGCDPFHVWGDGTQTRDWIHISDVVGAMFAALDSGEVGPVNLGTGIPTTFDELAVKVCEAAGLKLHLEHVLSAPQGVHFRVADVERLHKFYIPKVSLEAGIIEALEAA